MAFNLTSTLPGVGEILSFTCKVDILDCETSVSRTTAFRQSQIARLLFFPNGPCITHLKMFCSIRTRVAVWLIKIKQTAILPHCHIGTFAVGIQNLCLHSGLECPTTLWSDNTKPKPPGCFLGTPLTFIKTNPSRIHCGTLTYRNGQPKKKFKTNGRF